jgi:hypothetical protein
MSFPGTKFVSGLEAESRLICFLAGSLKRGYFQAGGFLVSSQSLPLIPNSVIFPDLSYSSSFWRIIAKTPHNDYAKPYPDSALTEVASKLVPAPPQPSLTASWIKLAPKFWSICAKDMRLSSVIQKIHHLVVLPTQYGTRGSFYPQKTRSGYIIHLTHRLDFPASELARTILLALYKINTQTSAEAGETAWDRRQAAVEFALSHSPLAQLFTPPSYSKPTPSHHTASNAYLAQLGLTLSPLPNLGALRPHLTVKEYLILEILIQNAGIPIDYSTLGDVIWGREVGDKYSLYAIAKHVQNLRRKLATCGYNSDLIKTSPSLGYYISS